jgi:hypothetical protein
MTGTSPVLANVGPVTLVGEQIEANLATNVVLEKETIDVRLSPMSAKVVCHFYLRNTGAAEHLTLGFPGKDVREKDDQNRTMEDFAVEVNDRKVRTTYQSHFSRSSQSLMHTISEQYGWYIWKGVFPADEVVHICISYTAINHNFGFTFNPYGDFVYVLATGSFWKEVIHQLDINVQFADMHVCQMTDFVPKSGTVKADKSLSWHFEELEPTWESNIKIWYEIEMFRPNNDLPAAEFSTKLKSKDVQKKLVQLDFQGFEQLIKKAVASANDQNEKTLLRILLQDAFLKAGKEFENRKAWQEAIQIYQCYKDTFGDIQSDLRPYSILSLRLAECYNQVNDTTNALAYFEASMDRGPMTKERYDQGMYHMFFSDAEDMKKEIPFRSRKSEYWMHYFYSTGLNAYCTANIESLKNTAK